MPVTYDYSCSACKRRYNDMRFETYEAALDAALSCTQEGCFGKLERLFPAPHLGIGTSQTQSGRIQKQVHNRGIIFRIKGDGLYAQPCLIALEQTVDRHASFN